MYESQTVEDYPMSI